MVAVTNSELDGGYQDWQMNVEAATTTVSDASKKKKNCSKHHCCFLPVNWLHYPSASLAPVDVGDVS